MAQIPLGNKGFVIVDDADVELLIPHKWNLVSHPKKKLYYARTIIDGHEVKMHRMLLDAPRSAFVDHVNGDGLDNRRCNLRLCTAAQNAQNRKIPLGHENKTSRYKGVKKYHRGDGWQARIQLNGKRKELGIFLLEISAAIAYDLAAKKQFGEFARLNVLKHEEKAS